MKVNLSKVIEQMGSLKKADLAKLYYPECTRQGALHGLARLIRQTPHLEEELIENGYRPSSNTPLLTPRQIFIIINRLGEP